MSEHEQGHIIEYATLIKVWATLLVLTGALVVSSRLSSGAAVWAMLSVTPLKAGLVFYFFMHVKYETIVLKTMLFVALSTLVVFIGMLFFDIAWRP